MVAAATDEQLVAAVLTGDTAAFGPLVDRYRDRVFNLAYRMLGDRENAHDAAQEAFVRAFSRLRTYRRDASFKSWLFGITSNLCIDRLRGRVRNPQSLDATEIDPVDENMPPQTAAAQTEIREATHRAIGRLPEAQRAAIVLVHLMGLSYEEAAEALDMPINTVKSHVHRGLEKLRVLMAPYMEECTP